MSALGKILPFAAGGLAGGLASSLFGGGSKKPKPTTSPMPTTTQGVPGPAASGPSGGY